MTYPMPLLPGANTNSTPTSVSTATPAAMRSPTNTCGSDDGSTTCRNVCQRLAPNERAASSNVSGTDTTALMVEIHTKKNTVMVSTAVTGASPKPKMMRNTGSSASFGTV